MENFKYKQCITRFFFQKKILIVCIIIDDMDYKTSSEQKQLEGG